MRKQKVQNCGLGPALNVIGGKWKATILWELHTQPLRFGALRRRVAGISEKILYEHLRQMEADGIVLRRALDTKRACVEYSLTEPGMKLNKAVHALAEWGTAYATRAGHDGSAEQAAKAAADPVARTSGLNVVDW